jgi:nucleoside phosphorylase
MDAHGLTAVCATRTEARSARRAGLSAAVVGVGVRESLPGGPLVSFGLAGALHEGLACGDVLDAVRVVDVDGATLWEGSPLGVSGARHATMLAADRVVDDAEERRRRHRRTGADAVDMESGALARSGRLAGCVRAVSDTPSRTLGRWPERWTRITAALEWCRRDRRPARESWRALGDVRRALRR